VFTAEEAEAIRLTLYVAIIAVAASLPIGVAVGYVLARFTFHGKTLLEIAVNLPLVLPPVVTGYLLLVVFGRRGWIGGYLENWFGLRFVFDWKGAALAAAIVSFPLLVRAIRLAFSSVDVRLEQAARTLGARPLDVFWSVSMPLARPGIISGCVLAFARSVGEFGATIMLAGNIPGETRTISLHIYTLMESPDGVARVHRLALVAIAIAAGALVIGEILERRGRRRLTPE
jgi:molybdate transport system permease protein